MPILLENNLASTEFEEREGDSLISLMTWLLIKTYRIHPCKFCNYMDKFYEFRFGKGNSFRMSCCKRNIWITREEANKIKDYCEFSKPIKLKWQKIFIKHELETANFVRRFIKKKKEVMGVEKFVV